MLFGPPNTPGFYSAMMRSMKEGWDSLFISRIQELTHLEDQVVVVSITMEVQIGGNKIIFGTGIIINDIFLWCSNVSVLFIYFK